MLEKEEIKSLNQLTTAIKDSKAKDKNSYDIKDEYVYNVKYEVVQSYNSPDYIDDFKTDQLLDDDVIYDLKEIFKVTNQNSYELVDDTTLKFEFIRVQGWSKSNDDYDYEDYKSFYTIKSTVEGIEHIEELINNTFDTNSTHNSEWFSDED